MGVRLETARLTLDPLRVADADEMVIVLGDTRLYEYTGGASPTLPELTDRYTLQAAGRSPDGTEEWLNWIVRLKGDGRAVGYVQATVVGDTADVAWVIGVPWQGKGYASEAAGAMVEWLAARGTRAITAHVSAVHEASARVALRIGLTATGEVEDGEIIWRRPA